MQGLCGRQTVAGDGGKVQAEGEVLVAGALLTVVVGVGRGVLNVEDGFETVDEVLVEDDRVCGAFAGVPGQGG